MAEVKTDLEALAKELGGVGLEILKGKLGGAEADLKKFGAAIGKDMLVAVSTGDDAWQAELVDQIKGLGELNRIRLNEGTWEFVGQTFAILAKLAMKSVSLTTFV